MTKVKENYKAHIGRARERMIYDLIGKEGKTSSELVGETNLSRARVTAYLRGMADKGMIYISGTKRPRRGSGPNLPIYSQKEWPVPIKAPVVKDTVPVPIQLSIPVQHWWTPLFAEPVAF